MKAVGVPPERARPSVLIVQPSLNPPGGANAVAAWMLQALADDYRCALLTLESPDFTAIDRFYGTSLARATVARLTAAPGLHAWLARMPLRLASLKSALLFAEARRISKAFDLVMTANGEADLGVPAIQYVHYPTRLYPRPDADRRWFHFSWLLRGYQRLCERIQPAPREAIARNVTLVNSAWCGAKMGLAYGVASDVVYPPVAWTGHAAPWDTRDPGFVTIGRLSPEKEFEKIIRVLGRVRAAGHAVHLHIVATSDADRAYGRRIRGEVERDAGWVSLHEDIPRVDLETMIGGYRFGIHGMVDEHFGIAIAEMIRAGAIVFVAAGGGQAEIVGQDERVTYTSEDDAVAKIVRVLENRDLQSVLRDSLADRAGLFSPERFMSAIRDAARARLRGSGERPRPSALPTSAAAR